MQQDATQGNDMCSFMKERVTRENCGQLLAALRNKEGVTLADLAATIGVSRSTVMRIEGGSTYPSEDFLNRLRALQLIGLSKFAQLNEKDKDKFDNAVKSVGADPKMLKAIMAGGLLVRLTPLGILTGLGTLGSASFIVGTGAVASVPIAAAIAGIGLVRALQKVTQANGLACEEIDDRWEIAKKDSANTEGER